MTGQYVPDVELHMKRFYESLSEKDRRPYPAVEPQKLGHGGMEYIAALFCCDAKTIRQGRADVAQLPHDEAPARVRKKGEPEVLS